MRCVAAFVVTLSIAVVAALNECVRRPSQETGQDDGHYCVCNATYCDEAPDATKPFFTSARYALITSSRSGLRFYMSNGIFRKDLLRDNVDGRIIINRRKNYQEILGFGGAVTDSACLNILKLTKKASDNLLRSYFGPNGINYNMLRAPMGGTDFSSRPYSYAMVPNDTTLKNFELQMEDIVYKIPVIKRAQQMKRYKIKLLTLPWSATPWMKTVDTWTWNSSLRSEYRQLWADYFVKYVAAYQRVGIRFWGLSSQNEPMNKLFLTAKVRLNGMQMTAEEERDWIIDYLWPTLKKNNFHHIKIFIMDENRLVLPSRPRKVFKKAEVRNIVSGIAVHMYFDFKVSPTVLDEVKRDYPEKLILITEGCIGVFEKKKVILGSWRRGEFYAQNILENLSHWASSWIDWNIALDTNGGPNYIGNYVDSPIIINVTANEFYKQPIFYAIGHFSKYIVPGSVRIGTILENLEKGIQSVAFFTPDHGIVLVILNM
ncbi:glucosylceramidase-like isoform X1 [Pseudomyrmex gracilis]|uniref:glucosylceramidase-like isoform X1 n=1 Tax=Pseudomyrmex gracilis TaxID=219809 RepID=UPI000994A26C|nr:glucosylceramidase-like isoform X1 [Pseudomyrmex gracilis]